MDGRGKKGVGREGGIGGLLPPASRGNHRPWQSDGWNRPYEHNFYMPRL